MSVEAITWALNLAPVPRDKNGMPNAACAFVLAGLANHADPDGTASFPGVPTLVRYTRLSERTVRTALDRLEAYGVISPCDPAIVAARIRRADRRPQGWDLDLSLVRDDLTSEDIASLERQFPGLRARVEAARAPEGAARGGVQPLHPGPPGPVDNPPGGVQPLHPAGGTGCNQCTDGVQLTHERGAAIAPEPSFEPSLEPSFKTSPPERPDPRPPGALAEPVPITRKPRAQPGAAASDPLFAAWYATYPVHKARGAAERAWAAALRGGADPQALLSAAAAYRADPQVTRGYGKHPATWLNGKCWLDEAAPAPARGGGHAAYQNPDDQSVYDRGFR